MNEFSWIPIVVTAIISVYGAVLSTYVAILQRIQFKRKIKVEISYGLNPSDGSKLIILQACNFGIRSISLEEPSMILPDNKKVSFLLGGLPYDVIFPYNLEEGKKCLVYWKTEDLDEELISSGFKDKVKIIGSFRDELGVTYKSKRIVHLIGKR